MDRRIVVVAVIVGVAETLTQAAGSAMSLFAVAKWTTATASFTWREAFMVLQSLASVAWTALVSYVAVYACRRWATQPAEGQTATPH
jgi:hypothetical protein